MEVDHQDYELVQLIKQKDAGALERLYDRYEKPMYAFAYRILKDSMSAEEVVQELFMRIWKSADRFEYGQGKISSWMFAIVRNISIDVLRKKQSRMPVPYAPEEQLDHIKDQKQTVESEVELKWVRDQVKEAIHHLNYDQQAIIDLIYYQGFTQQEVSDIHSIPLGTVKSRVRLAMKQLKGKLAGVGREGVRT